jgi:hypothetical protein
LVGLASPEPLLLRAVKQRRVNGECRKNQVPLTIETIGHVAFVNGVKCWINLSAL